MPDENIVIKGDDQPVVGQESALRPGATSGLQGNAKKIQIDIDPKPKGFFQQIQ